MGKLNESNGFLFSYNIEQINEMLENLPDGIREKEPFRTMLTESTYAAMKKWGVDCMYIRNPLGIYCGYARIKKGHPLNGASAGEIEQTFTVHGGITYCKRVGPDLIIGFDCGHYLDQVPYLELATKGEDAYRLFSSASEGIYRTEEYVREQLTELARQIKEKEYENTFR